jgi:hypothetical protein
MSFKDEIHDSIRLELHILEHVFNKIPKDDPQALEYRPSPGQRSLLELLRYLSYAGIGGCLAAVEGGFEGFRRVAARAEDMPAEDFPAALARQKEEIAELFARLTDEDLMTRQTKKPLGQELSLAKGLLELPFRWLVAYRMQLFLYAKAVGADLWTPDCWYGIHRDRPAPKS